MTNEELIKQLRGCKDIEFCNECPRMPNGIIEPCGIKDDAADALEAAENRIVELKRGWDKALARATEYEAKAIELEAQLPKEGEWVWENYYWHCSACGENPTRGMGYVQGKNELFRVCPNCGSRMAKGEQE